MAASQMQSQTTDSSVMIHYRSEKYPGPFPESHEIDSNGREIFSQGGSYIYQISPGLVVKYGTRVTKEEAETLLFVKRLVPNMPVPRVHAYYTTSLEESDLERHGNSFRTYIVMDFVPGRRLDEVWKELSNDSKSAIAQQLRGHINQLRSISQEGKPFIGSILRGPVQDYVFETADSKGPFESEDDFNAALVDTHEKNLPHMKFRLHLEGGLACHKHQIVFTHGDLRGCNIMIHEEQVSGIIDWEMSGWYPAYWDFAKCFAVANWDEYWPKFVVKMLEPFWSEWALQDFIRRHLW